MLVRRVATDARLVVGQVDAVVGPVLQGDDRDLRAVTDVDLDDLSARIGLDAQTLAREIVEDVASLSDGEPRSASVG